MDLLLVRHGRPQRIDYDPEGADPQLTELGHRQAHAMARYLADEPIDALYTSPQRRARQTAMPLVCGLRLEPTVVDGIAEFDLGHHSYIPGEEAGPLSDEELREMIGYLTSDAFVGRVRMAVDQIVSDHAGETVAAVCHGGVISTVMHDLLGTDPASYFDADYTSVTRIRASRDGRRSLISFNECHWLRGLR